MLTIYVNVHSRVWSSHLQLRFFTTSPHFWFLPSFTILERTSCGTQLPVCFISFIHLCSILVSYHLCASTLSVSVFAWRVFQWDGRFCSGFFGSTWLVSAGPSQLVSPWFQGGHRVARLAVLIFHAFYLFS